MDFGGAFGAAKWLLAIGALFWLTAAAVLHVLARLVLGRLK
jgi:hypothetical protein